MAYHKSASAGFGGAAARSAREHVALTDQQWAALAPLVPGADGSARGRLAPPQHVVEGILFAIRNGMGMQSVPPPYPSGSTLYRRYSAWTASGQWDTIWAAFLETLSPSERRKWEAAAERRPGVSSEVAAAAPHSNGAAAVPLRAAAVPLKPAQAATPQPAAPDAPRSTTFGALPSRTEAPSPPPSRTEASSPPPSRTEASLTPPSRPEPITAAPVQLSETRTAYPMPDETTSPVYADAPMAGSDVSADAARERVTKRLGLSSAQSEIVSRRIDDHGVTAALQALDEVERRVATNTMRGVGGMPMSAFEIWVCAVGLSRQPVERPRAPRPERTERFSPDRDRRKRQWRKTP